MTIVVRDWRAPEPQPVLSPDVIHLWRITLSETDGREEAAEVLGRDEMERAGRLRFDADRRRFLAAHAGLRSILARYLSVPPASLGFRTGRWGKPLLDHGRHGTALRFNLSHSHDLALVAVASHREVGVDVERVRPLPDLDGIVARFFSPAERAAFGRLPRERRPQAFFRCWTLKEAYLKASGDGMSRRLDQVEVGSETDLSASSLRVLDRPGDERRWEISTLEPSREYVAAVAVETCEAPPSVRSG